MRFRLRPRVAGLLQRVARAILPTREPVEPARRYSSLWEAHSRVEHPVGVGGYEKIGLMELGLLQEVGLRPSDTILDLGCGTARLGVHLVPWLVGGHYLGADVALGMLAQATTNLAGDAPAPPCVVSLLQHDADALPFADASLDFACAFSVFTHIDPEDTFRCLSDLLRVVRPGGHFVFSCLPLSTPLGEATFRAEATMRHPVRWSRARNVTTTVEAAEQLATLAGWEIVRWYMGTEKVPVAGTGEAEELGQSACVLRRP